MSRAVALALLCSTACDDASPITSCRQDLTGTYEVDGARWNLLDDGITLEAYPQFADVPDLEGVAGVEVAPRMLALERDPRGIAGTMQRRFLQGSAVCVSRVRAQVTACADDALDIVVADPVAPLSFEGPVSVELAPGREPETASTELFGLHVVRRVCVFPRPDGSRRERWHRVLTR